MKLFIEKTVKGILAEAEYDPTDKRFIVLKGSKVSENISSAPSFKSAKAVKTLREKYVFNRLVIENVYFKVRQQPAILSQGEVLMGQVLGKIKMVRI